ncbi:MAG: dual specificity protein phosphatase family protein [Desulfatibacillaceae bacterium]
MVHKPYRIYWIYEDEQTGGRLAISSLPGRPDVGRDLYTDMEAMADAGVDHVVVLVEDHELRGYGLPGLVEAFTNFGLDVRRLPTPDFSVPAMPAMVELVDWIDTRTGAGGVVLVHCVGGLGRSGTVAACFLKKRGFDSGEAIRMVRERRSSFAIEGEDQVAMVRAFGEET